LYFGIIISMSHQAEEFKSGSLRQYSSVTTMTMMMDTPMKNEQENEVGVDDYGTTTTSTTRTLHPLFTRRPDRITITIHREDASDELGLLWRDNVIIGVQKSGLLILDTSPTTSSSSANNSVLRVGDVLQRVNGLPWSATLAKDLVIATGSMVFDFATTTMVSLSEYESSAEQEQPIMEQQSESYNDIEQIDGLVAGRGRGVAAVASTMTTRTTTSRNITITTTHAPANAKR
jgi:hypothetical protein